MLNTTIDDILKKAQQDFNAMDAGLFDDFHATASRVLRPQTGGLFAEQRAISSQHVVMRSPRHHDASASMPVCESEILPPSPRGRQVPPATSAASQTMTSQKGAYPRSPLVARALAWPEVLAIADKVNDRTYSTKRAFKGLAKAFQALMLLPTSLEVSAPRTILSALLLPTQPTSLSSQLLVNHLQTLSEATHLAFNATHETLIQHYATFTRQANDTPPPQQQGDAEATVIADAITGLRTLSALWAACMAGPAHYAGKKAAAEAFGMAVMGGVDVLPRLVSSMEIGLLLTNSGSALQAPRGPNLKIPLPPTPQHGQALKYTDSLLVSQAAATLTWQAVAMEACTALQLICMNAGLARRALRGGQAEGPGSSVSVAPLELLYDAAKALPLGPLLLRVLTCIQVATRDLDNCQWLTVRGLLPILLRIIETGRAAAVTEQQHTSAPSCAPNPRVASQVLVSAAGVLQNLARDPASLLALRAGGVIEVLVGNMLTLTTMATADEDNALEQPPSPMGSDDPTCDLQVAAIKVILNLHEGSEASRRELKSLLASVVAAHHLREVFK